MKKYRINEQTFAVIDGDLYLLVLPLSPDENQKVQETKTQVQKPKPSAKEEKQNGKKWGRRALSAQHVREIQMKHAAGISAQKLAEMYNVSTATIYNKLKTAESDAKTDSEAILQKNKKVTYRCHRDHEFTSTAPADEALCPDCSSMNLVVVE